MLARAFHSRWFGLPVLLAAFVCWTVTVLAVWSSGERTLATGDEPHYLLVAESLVEDGTLRPEAVYVRDLAAGGELPPEEVTLESAVELNRAHLVHGPHGWYSIHGVGLPVVLAPAVAIDPALARLVTIAIGALAVAAVWGAAGLWFTDRRRRTWVAAPLALAFPVVAASTQLYPDLPGGLLCLVGLVAIARAEQGTPWRHPLLVAIALAALPWLHIRFALPAVVLLAGLIWSHRRGRSWAGDLVLGLPLLVSAAGLAVYQWWAFGDVAGPYGAEASSFGGHALMVLLGLVVDQNQGILAQQPLHLVGLCCLVPFVRRHRLLAWTTIAVVLLVLVPSAVHPNWYGGTSFSGRFGWAPSLALVPLTCFGLARLAATRPRWIAPVLIAGAAAQAWYLAHLFGGHQALYQRPSGTPIERYSMHFGLLGRLLPAFHDTSMAWTHVPNLLAVLLVAAAVVVGPQLLDVGSVPASEHPPASAI